MRLSRVLAAVTLASMLTPLLMACNDDPDAALKEGHDPAQFRRVLESSTSATPPATSSASPLPGDCSGVPGAGSAAQPDATAEAIACDDDGVVYRLAPAEIVGGVQDADAVRPNGSVDWLVNIDLDDDATPAFADLSAELVGTQQQLAILVDALVISAPVINAAVTDGKVQIAGPADGAEARKLATALER